MSDRCEPPPELRSVDGDFWVERGGTQSTVVWLADPQCWILAGYDVSPGMLAERGFRYISPVATPTEVEAIRAERDALLAEQKAYDTPAWVANEQLNEQVDTLRARVAELERLVEATDAAMEFMHPLSDSGMTDAEFASLWNATHEALRAALSPATEAAPE